MFVQCPDGVGVDFAVHAGGQTSVRYDEYLGMRLLTSTTVFVCDSERWVARRGFELSGEGKAVDRGNRRQSPFGCPHTNNTLSHLVSRSGFSRVNRGSFTISDIHTIHLSRNLECPKSSQDASQISPVSPRKHKLEIGMNKHAPPL